MIDTDSKTFEIISTNTLPQLGNNKKQGLEIFFTYPIFSVKLSKILNREPSVSFQTVD